MHTFRRLAVAASLALSATVTALATAPLPASAAADDLIISQYTEGSSFNKAIEIYNGTGADVDLSNYALLRYSNGNTSSTSISLSGTLLDGDVFVIAEPRAIQELLDTADVTSGSLSHNGNDSYELTNNDTVIDSIGQVGNDANFAVDTTLTRNADVCSGDAISTDSFDPSLEWTASAPDSADGFGSHTANCGDVEPPSVVINEFSVSTTGTDVEYVEISGAPNTDYSNLTIVGIEGDYNATTDPRGVIDNAITVGTTDGAGFWLADVSSNTFENGTLTLLLVSDFTGAVGDDLDTDGDGTLDVTPWADIVDAVAVNDGTDANDLTYGTPVLGVEYDGLPFSPGGASRIPDGADTDTAADWVRNDFELAGIDGFTGTPIVGEAYNTPGAPNEAVIDVPPPPTGPCDVADVTLISAVQGAGAASPLAGQTVTIRGIVVADHQDGAAGVHGDLNGYHLQEEDADADADPATSEGIFVYDPGTAVDVQPGDQVAVTGPISEFSGLTEITVDAAEVCTPAPEAPTATPATFTLPAPDLTGDAQADYATYVEQFEGMSVVMPDPMTISEYFNYDRFGEVVLTVGRQNTPTAIYAPGTPEAAALADANLRARITLDDGLTSQNPSPIRHPDGSVYSVDNSFRGGDTLTGVTGVMYYAFDLFRIQPTGPAEYTVVNPRPAGPPDVGGDLSVMSLNVLNYFSEFGISCGPADNQDCRGADNETERVRQLDKIVNTVAGASPAVAGLIELGNPSSTIAPDDDPELNQIVSALNAELGAGTYDFVRTGSVGMDAIRQGIIYQPALVTPVGGPEILSTMSFMAPNTIDPQNRPAVAQVFVDNATGAEFAVVVNHLKSKGSACDPTAEVTPDDDPEAGSCNLTRTLAVGELLTWIDNIFETDNVLVVGDLNSYDEEAPIRALEAAGYVDLEGYFGGPEAYSYVFDGQIGYLDYAVASPGIFDQVTGAASWHINADEPDILSYDTSFTDPQYYADDVFRASDHDPVLVGLSLTPVDVTAPTVTVEQGAGQDDPVYEGPVVFDVVFSEPVIGFDADDVVVTGPAGAVTVTQVDDLTYTVSVEALDYGTITASVNEDAAVDGAGNPSEASTSVDNSVTVVDPPPFVTVEQHPDQADPATSNKVRFVVNFSEPVVAFDASMVDTTGEVANVKVTQVDDTTWVVQLTLKGKAKGEVVTASVPAGVTTDLVGNPNESSTSVDNEVTFTGK